jgi:hypothetical protein
MLYLNNLSKILRCCKENTKRPTLFFLLATTKSLQSYMDRQARPLVTVFGKRTVERRQVGAKHCRGGGRMGKDDSVTNPTAYKP